LVQPEGISYSASSANILDGAIRTDVEVATRRWEFAAILRNDGIDGPIAALNRKADILIVTTARSF
jgi:hypothetical protein